MESTDTWTPTFVVGQHESARKLPVTPETVQKALDCGYDIVTRPITTPAFQTKVLTLLSAYLAALPPPAKDAHGTLATSGNTKFLRIPSLLVPDSHLSPGDAVNNVVAVSSSWIDVCSPDPLIADISRQILLHELAYAAFCGVSYVIIPGPRLHHGTLHGEGLMYYARAIQEVMNAAPYVHIHIWFRMTDNPDDETSRIGDLAPFARPEFIEAQEFSTKPEEFGTWDAWDVIRRICKYHARLLVALTLPKNLPPMPVQTRWLSEPVHILTIEEATFISNSKLYPVLSRRHQAIISRFMRNKSTPWIILNDVGEIPDTSESSADLPTPAEAAQRAKAEKGPSPTPHLEYIRNLQKKQPPRTAMERFGVGYQDYLQAPLQPLTVNLESVTYEVFEKDPIKYEWYERAILKALKDWAAQKKKPSSPDGRIVVAVVGAGRGPLVTRTIRSSVEADVDIELWAIEKNQNAFLHLQRQNNTIWGDSVNLVQSDMRSWKGPLARVSIMGSPEPRMVNYPVDIFISELLGSFGDNELSPECLDGVSHLLNPAHGISIPASYTAYVTPISSPRLHAEVTAQSITNPAAPETPYVVMLHAFDFLSTAEQPPRTPSPKLPNTKVPSEKSSTSSLDKAAKVPPPTLETANPIIHPTWSFSHPNKNIPPPLRFTAVLSNEHNMRKARLAFPCRERGVCHGLGGYFETTLYEGVELSTNPVTMDTKSESMISWFPIYFPLKTPLHVPENSEIVVTMYRQTDNRKVWYEWVVEVFEFRNSDGSIASPGEEGARRLRVAMSDLHSSIKDGCLM